MDIQQVGIVGGGTMGSGIAEVCAKAGVPTTVVEIDAAAAEQVQRRIAKSLGRAQDRGRITAEAHDAAMANLSYSHDLADLAGSDLVIEAVIENLEEKRRIFGLLDDITPPHATLASNTSSIAIIDLATATGRPSQVVGMHFFNPAPVQPLVEVVRSVASAAERGRRGRRLRHRAPRQARHPLRGPGRLRREPPAGALPAGRHRAGRLRPGQRTPTSTPA